MPDGEPGQKKGERKNAKREKWEDLADQMAYYQVCLDEQAGSRMQIKSIPNNGLFYV